MEEKVSLVNPEIISLLSATSAVTSKRFGQVKVGVFVLRVLEFIVSNEWSDEDITVSSLTTVHRKHRKHSEHAVSCSY